MRRAPCSARLTNMEISVRRVILDAAIDRSVIRGTLTAPSGERRDFHGWLELSTALETILDRGGNDERHGPARAAP